MKKVYPKTWHHCCCLSWFSCATKALHEHVQNSSWKRIGARLFWESSGRVYIAFYYKGIHWCCLSWNWHSLQCSARSRELFHAKHSEALISKHCGTRIQKAVESITYPVQSLLWDNIFHGTVEVSRLRPQSFARTKRETVEVPLPVKIVYPKTSKAIARIMKTIWNSTFFPLGLRTVSRFRGYTSWYCL